jgi:hypothetical protein
LQPRVVFQSSEGKQIPHRHQGTHFSYISPYARGREKQSTTLRPVPEEGHQYSTVRFSNQSYGYGYVDLRETRKVGGAVGWSQGSKYSDSRAEWQLTARPRESPKEVTATQTEKLEWPRHAQPEKGYCHCECCF